MIKILSYNEIDTTNWNELLASSSTSTFFQSKVCYDFYTQLPFMSPFLYGVSQDGKLVGLCCGYIISEGKTWKHFFSRRAIVPGGLLLDQTISDRALTALTQALHANLKKKAIYVELRNYSDYTFVKKIIEHSGFTYQPHLNIRVSTIDRTVALKNLSQSKRWQLKQNRKANLSSIESKNIDDLKDFYAILKNLYKTKIKKPLFPFSFFELLVKEPFTHFFVVKKDGEVKGGTICVELDGKILYEWFLCGKHKQELDIYPSLEASWAAIEYACTHGFLYFDFMGAGSPTEDYGVRDFKKQFGGDIVEYGRFLAVYQPFLYRLGKIYIKHLHV